MLSIITVDIGRQIQVGLVKLPPLFVTEDESSNSRREREREIIEVTWGRKGRGKRGESNQASNHIPK